MTRPMAVNAIGRFCFQETALLKLSKLKDRYAGRPAAILGGGPSLPADLKQLPKGCLLIAVNYHGFYHTRPGAIKYMVYNDTPETNPLQVQAVREHRAIHVSPEPTTDVLFDVPDVWTGFFSSNTATWFALWLGCDPVILCGMDCYQGPKKHCEPSTYYSPMFDMPLDFYTRPWTEDCRNSVPHPERIRAMSGPLVDVFGAYSS
jgi:hypothetical protein